jgi:hypothetical protein
MLPVLALLLTLAGCSLLYLSHRHQGWLRQPLPAVSARVAGVAVLLLALVCAGFSFSPLTAFFVWVVMLMLIFSLLPFLSLLRPRDER